MRAATTDLRYSCNSAHSAAMWNCSRRLCRTATPTHRYRYPQVAGKWGREFGLCHLGAPLSRAETGGDRHLDTERTSHGVQFGDSDAMATAALFAVALVARGPTSWAVADFLAVYARHPFCSILPSACLVTHSPPLASVVPACEQTLQPFWRRPPSTYLGRRRQDGYSMARFVSTKCPSVIRRMVQWFLSDITIEARKGEFDRQSLASRARERAHWSAWHWASRHHSLAAVYYDGQPF